MLLVYFCDCCSSENNNLLPKETNYPTDCKNNDILKGEHVQRVYLEEMGLKLTKLVHRPTSGDPAGSIASLQMGPGNFSLLQFISRQQRPVPQQKMTALKSGIYGIVPC